MDVCWLYLSKVEMLGRVGILLLLLLINLQLVLPLEELVFLAIQNLLYFPLRTRKIPLTVGEK